MKFKLVENLEDDLIQENKLIEDITNDLIAFFKENNFEISIEINGINFENTYEDIYASFYIDNKLNYKGYVTNDIDSKNTFSVKGNINTVIKNSKKLVKIFELEIDNL